MKKIFTILLATALALGAMDADAARRLGGGGSIGRQSGNVTQHYSAPSQSPAQVAPRDGVQRPAPAPAGAAPQPVPQRRPWAGMLGGLAAGLGLAWLAHSLGFGAAFGQFLLFALLAVVLLAVFAAMRRRNDHVQREGAWPGSTIDSPLSPPQYNPEKIGNDASARPWEHGSTGLRIGSALESQGSALAGSQNWGVPAGFDSEGFLAAAKRNFVTLQDAWDRGDLKSLRGMMTDEMVREIGAQIGERERQSATPGRTEVVMLEAKLLGIEELATEYMASVEFSGMIREDPSVGPAPFREVWNMVKPRDGSAGWLVAGVQALQ